MTFSQKYTIVQLFEDLPDEYEYDRTNWPLHTTIVDVFAINWNAEYLVKVVENFSRNQKPFASTVGDDALLGENHVHVTLIDKTPRLAKLHADLVRALTPGDFAPNNPQFFGENFLPHSTIQKHSRLRKNDIIQFNTLTIIDMFPDENAFRRRIVRTLPFAN